MGSDHDEDVCFECLGEALWCPVCKKGLPMERGEGREKQAAEPDKQYHDPDQLSLL